MNIASRRTRGSMAGGVEASPLPRNFLSSLQHDPEKWRMGSAMLVYNERWCLPTKRRQPAAPLHPHQEFCMIVPNGFKVISQRFSIIAPSKLPFAAVHESEVGTFPPFADVRVMVAIEGKADMHRAWQNRRD
jgi:hypothetical protein